MIEKKFIEVLYAYMKQASYQGTLSPEIYLHVPREAKFPYIHVEVEEMNDLWEGPIKSKSCIRFSLIYISSSLGPQEIIQMVRCMRESLEGRILELADSYEGIIKHIKEKSTLGSQKGLYKAQDFYNALIRLI